MKTILAGLLVILALFSLQCSSDNSNSISSPRFINKIDYYGKGSWLKIDTHTHTTFTDGKHSVEEVVAEAKRHACDVIAITDHSDAGDGAATPEYFAEIKAAQSAHPEIFIFAGIEWNIPPFGGSEHMTILLPNALAEAHLEEFKERFDDYKREDTPSVRKALNWLKDVAPSAVLFQNHPSRKDSLVKKNVVQMKQWMDINDLVVGMSGAPGHQIGGKRGIGAYSYFHSTVDRWDPAVAEVGNAWDILLAGGKDVWAARAASDFHKFKAKNAADFWPGQFSETWLYAPDKSETSILKALRAGSFFAAHGHIVRKVQLEAMVSGLERPAYAGETIAVPSAMEITVSLTMDIPETDWQGAENRIDRVEIIQINEGGGASVLAAGSPLDGKFETTVVMGENGLVLRARGIREMPDEPNLKFYTNPIRIKLP